MGFLPKSITLIVLIGMIFGCSGEFNQEDYEPGENGEPPIALGKFPIHETKFVADEKNYVLALGNIHSFLVVNKFTAIYPSCFDDVLDIRITIENFNHRFPCVALQATKGSPTKVYLSVTINEVKFNQLDGNNRLIYTVSMFGRKNLTDGFVAEIEPLLRSLYTNAPVTTESFTP